MKDDVLKQIANFNGLLRFVDEFDLILEREKEADISWA